MSLDRKLLDILVCPESHQPLAMLAPEALDAVNRAIAAGTVTRADGTAQDEALGAGLLRRDGKRVYRIDDGIPVLLVEEAIDTAQVSDFPQA